MRISGRCRFWICCESLFLSARDQRVRTSCLIFRIGIITWPLLVTGCNLGPEMFTAKWASQDEVYSAQYDKPYSRNP